MDSLTSLLGSHRSTISPGSHRGVGITRHGDQRPDPTAREAEGPLGQLQHYFSSRAAMLTFSMEFAAEQTSHRVTRGLATLDEPPHPREVLRVVVTEMLPLHPDARATSRMNAAYVLEALHDPDLHEQASLGLREGRTSSSR
ncbi:hypothetical protein [Nocardioides sp. NPDC006273]|uniref:hypothetical protein n=1 Tax=Nocardioides sp. NPDC006273 TaxID=3155598 RepID=UPI0033A3B733